MNLINLFPLTILKDKIELKNNEKDLMINEIRLMKKNSKNYFWWICGKFYCWTISTRK